MLLSRKLIGVTCHVRYPNKLPADVRRVGDETTYPTSAVDDNCPRVSWRRKCTRLGVVRNDGPFLGSFEATIDVLPDEGLDGGALADNRRNV